MQTCRHADLASRIPAIWEDCRATAISRMPSWKQHCRTKVTDRLHCWGFSGHRSWLRALRFASRVRTIRCIQRRRLTDWPNGRILVVDKKPPRIVAEAVVYSLTLPAWSPLFFRMPFLPYQLCFSPRMGGETCRHADMHTYIIISYHIILYHIISYNSNQQCIYITHDEYMFSQIDLFFMVMVIQAAHFLFHGFMDSNNIWPLCGPIGTILLSCTQMFP